MKWRRLLSRALLFMLGSLLAVGAYFALTETGFQWLFTRLTRVLPGELEAQRIEGHLGQALALHGVRYRTDEFTLEVDRIDFAWRAVALLRATLWVERLHFQGVNWYQHGPAAPREREETITLPEVGLPLKVHMESLRIQDLTLFAYEASPVAIKVIAFRGFFEDHTLQLSQLRAVAPEGQLQVQGTVTLRGDYPLDLATRWQARIPEGATLGGKGEVRGDLRRLALRQALETPVHLQLRAKLSDLTSDLRWALILEVPEADLRRLQPQWPAVRLGMRLRGAGRLDRFKFRGSYHIREAQWGEFHGEFAGGQEAPNHWVLRQLDLRHRESAARAAVRGDMALKEGKPYLSLIGQWQELAWPLTGTAWIASDEGRLTFGGYPQAYRLQVQAALAGEDLPAGEWHLSGTGDTRQFQLETLRARLLDGILDGIGSLRWDPALAWQLHLDGEALNLARQWPEWPGEVGFQVHTAGVLEDKVREIMVDLQALAGTLRGFPVSAQGAVRLQNAVWQITDFKLRSGASRLSLEGSVEEEQLALEGQLNSPDLAQLLPGAAGVLAGRAQLAGSLEQPQVNLRLEGKGLAYGEWRLAAVNADARLDLEGRRSSRLALDATGLAFEDQTFRSLRLKGSGTPSQHGLNLMVVERPERSLTLQIQGTWQEELWQGVLQAGRVTDPLAGQWSMVEAVPLTLSRRRVDLAPWCWQQQAAHLCIGGRWQAEQRWEGEFRAVNFPLDALAPLLPEEMVLEGTLAGEAGVRGSARHLEQVGVRLDITAGRLTHTLPDTRVFIVPYQELQVELRLDEGQGQGYVEWLGGETGETRISASLEVPPLVPLDMAALEAPLSLLGGAWRANLEVTDFPLSLLAPFLPEQLSLMGEVGASARLRGEGDSLSLARVRLTASPGRLVQEMPEEQTLTLLHQGLQAALYVDERGGYGHFEWLLAELGNTSLGAEPLRATLRLPPTPLDLTALDRLPLAGHITAAVNDLAFLELMFPELRDVQGQLGIDLELGGQVGDPQVLGHLDLQNGRARILPLGVELTRTRLRVEAQGADRVAFSGEVHSGEGQIAIEGQIRLDADAGWPGQVHIVGEQFEAARTPEVEVSISPRLEVTLAKHRIQVEGEVTVPQARLSPVDVKQRGGITTSEDAVILSKEKEGAVEAREMPVYARVRVILGDKVAVQAYGFTGRMAGSLVVTDAPERSTRGSGELRVRGQYAAYGVQLNIQEGRVIFVGPIDSPRVNVRAVRQVGDVVAGVEVRGPAAAPELTLFSEPTMNQENVLAYLILGRPLRTASGEEGEMLANAAVSIGLSGGNLLAQRIGRTFGLERVGIEEIGIEEVGVGAERDPQRAALMLGRNLSPRLYVGYGIGIFQRFNAFRMRYLLTDSWSLQAETGLESSVDLFYNLER